MNNHAGVWTKGTSHITRRLTEERIAGRVRLNMIGRQCPGLPFGPKMKFLAMDCSNTSMVKAAVKK